MKNLNSLLVKESVEVSNTDELLSINDEQIELKPDPPADTSIFAEYMVNDPQFIGFEDKNVQEFCYRLATYGLINPTTSGSTILDLRSRRGDLFSYLNSVYPGHQYNLIGTEPDKLLFDIAKQKNSGPNIQYYNLDFQDNEIKDFKADLVFHILGLSKVYNTKKVPPEVLLNTLIDTMYSLKNSYAVLILFNSGYELTDHYNIHPSTVIQILESKSIRYAIDYLDNEMIYKVIF